MSDTAKRSRDRDSRYHNKPEASSDSDEESSRRRIKGSRRDPSNERRSDGHRYRRKELDEDREPRRSRNADSSRRERRYRDRSNSRSPPRKPRRSSDRSRSPREEPRRNRAPLPSQTDSFHGTKNVTTLDSTGPPIEKEKPNYKPTGLLAKEANTVSIAGGTTTILKYHEPPEARKPPPKEAWRMYVFKQKDLLDTVYLHERSVWLVGRDQNVTDLLLEHPSISKQHAVVQFRFVTSRNEFGDKMNRVKPYLIDLESANGTKLNGKAVEASRYVELVDGDVVAFGNSEREYVMMLPPAEK